MASELSLARKRSALGEDATRTLRALEEQLEQPAAGPRPAAPQIDLDALTNRVYDELERRLRLERQRRGL